MGDSPEQNGAYTIVLARIKKDIINWKEQQMMPILTIEVTESMILVNYA